MAGRRFTETTQIAEMTTLPTIPSPCIAVCQLDPKSGLCIGCFRTVEEIGVWSTASDAERLEMLNRLKERRRAAGRTSAADSRPRRRRGGRRPASGD